MDKTYFDSPKIFRLAGRMKATKNQTFLDSFQNTAFPPWRDCAVVYCIFGDSVTQAAYIKVGWVDLLKHYLEDKYRGDFINVFNLGVGGNTTGDILKRFRGEALSRNPTSIIFAVGINDTKNNNQIEFKVNLKKLVKLAKEFSSDITFVGLVLGDWTGEEPFNQEKTRDYNQIINEVAESENCKFIPLQDELNSQDFMDGLHPNDQGHKKIFEAIKNILGS